MLRLDQYESLSSNVNRFLWSVDRIGRLFRRTPHASPGNRRYEGLRKILLLRCDGIGDLICSIPAIQALCAAYPEARLDLMVGPWNRDIAGMIDGPSSVVPHAPWGYRVLRSERGSANLGEDWRIGRAMRSAGYDLAVDLRGDLLSLLPLAFWNIPRRVGRIARGGGFAVTRAVEGSDDRNAHEVDRTNRVAAAVGAPATGRQPRLSVSGEAIALANAILAEHALDPAHTVLLCPFAQWAWKQWPEEHYRRLVPWLRERGYRVAATGSAADAGAAEALSREVGGHLVNLAGKADLKGLAGLFFLCRAFIAVDSGPAHVAAATGAPGIVLFGSSDPARFGPISNRVQLLQKTDCPLFPCYQRGECQNQQNWCMEKINVAEVQNALSPILSHLAE